MTFGSRVAALMLLGLSLIRAQDADDVGPRPWINEFHYENRGTDVNEFIEVAAPEGLDISSWQLILYNGFYGRVYAEDAYHPLVTFEKGESVNGVDFYYLPFKPANCSSLSAWCGLQNGKDGFALAQYFTATSGRVVELLSYEGTFFAKDGPATNMTSRDVGVMQITNTPKGHSISKIGTGCAPDDFYWANSDKSTMGTVNTDQTVTCDVAFINEFHYDNVNNGEGQFVEVASNVDDLSSYSLVLYSGEDGLPYETISLSSFEAGDTTDDGLTFYVYDFSSSGAGGGLVVETAAEDATATGMALVKDETVVEFISYGGEFVAQGGVAEGITSMDIGVEESSETPVGSSLQLIGVGCSSIDFLWEAVEANQIDINPMGSTPGRVNIGQDIACIVEVPEPETIAPEEDEDDLLEEDDDFLGDDVVMMAAGEEVVVEYSMGKRSPVPLE